MAGKDAAERSPPHLSSYFDMTTFVGRLRYNFMLCNPLNLRWGAREVADAKSTLKSWKDGVHVETSALQHAQTVLAVNAPNGEQLPPPCRTSGWALATVPVMAFIQWNAAVRPTSLPHIIAGQWLNQTQNAAITWCNRPPPPVESTQERAQTNARLSETARAVSAYVAACATAIPIAVGAGLGANRSPLLRPLGKFAPYPAVALANVVNTCMMRSDDLVSGVPVTTDGADTSSAALGRSVVAGQRAVRDTALTRTLIPLANFVAAPVIMAGLERLLGTSGRPRSLPLQVTVTGVVLVAAIPLAAAVSPPICTIAIEDVEPPIREASPDATRELVYTRGF